MSALKIFRTITKPKPLTPGQCQKLIERYPDDLELWRRFWEFMAQKSARGASFDYVLSSYETLEEAWLAKPKPQIIRRGLFKRPA